MQMKLQELNVESQRTYGLGHRETAWLADYSASEFGNGNARRGPLWVPVESYSTGHFLREADAISKTAPGMLPI
jgi:hypothetical protein